MLTPVAGIAFVTLAATNVVVMLEASQPSRNRTTRTRLIALHKAGGYLFVSLLCIMAYSMSQRLVSVGITGHLPTHLVLHIVLVLVLVPLLFLKILIARHYKHSHSGKVETVVFLHSKRSARFPPEARCWIWPSETASRFRLAAARANVVRVLRGF